MADVFGLRDEKPLIIEVFVTHKVDGIKKNLIEQLGIPSIEVDFSDFTYDMSKEEIKRILLDESRSKWIYYPIDVEMIDLYSLVFREERLQSMSRCAILKKEQKSYSYHGYNLTCSACPKRLLIQGNRVVCSGRHTFRTQREFKAFMRDEDLNELLDELLKNDVLDRGSFYGRELLEDFLKLVKKKEHEKLPSSDLRYMRKMYKLIMEGNIPNLLQAKRMERIIKKCI